MYEALKKQISLYGRPVVLVGMMGTGKTHFGRMISAALDLKYYDSDALVEEKAGCSISEIFERWGEERFREVEAKTVQELASGGVCVVSTGGGAVMNPETADIVFGETLSVWIHAPFDAILQRVAKNKKRPLLACENPRDVLQQLIQAREPVYRRARFNLSSEEGKAEVVMDGLFDEMRSYLTEIL